MLSTFKQTKKIFKKTVQTVLTKQRSYQLDEAALPAYAHKNCLIDYIFWKRVEITYEYALRKDAKRVLDFGCGVGVLSYALAQKGVDVIAIDLNLEPLRLMQQHLSFPDNIQFIEKDLLDYPLEEASFDMIIALDVLEHIAFLDTYIQQFKRLLKPDGVLLVSGPTENYLYKLGRKLAGENFTGDYHVSDIYIINKQIKRHMNTKIIAKLVWPFTLFEIIEAKK